MNRVKGELFMNESKYILEFRSDAFSAAVESKGIITEDMTPVGHSMWLLMG
jgi:hypothetical protein